MPATVQSRGLLKASTNRVRTSAALQGSTMWENVIGVVNEERGTNARVEAMLNAPQHGHTLGKDRKARREAAAAAMKATGNFDTEITDYESLLSLAKSQGVVGDGEKRGACRICGQMGHLTKQCRNQFSKFYNDGKNNTRGLKPETSGKAELSGVPGAVANQDGLAQQQAPNWSASSSSDLSDLSDTDSDGEERRSRRKRRKHGSSRRRRSREKSHRSHHRHRDDERREKKRKKRSHREKYGEVGRHVSSEGRSGSRRRENKSSSRR